MGYYSQVSIAIEFPSTQHLKEFVAVQRTIPDRNLALERWQVVDKVLFYTNEFAKWYDDFPEVQAHMAVLKEANDQGFATSFLRLGEEYDDTEQEFTTGEHSDYTDPPSGYYLLSAQRHIELEFSSARATSVKDFIQGE